MESPNLDHGGSKMSQIMTTDHGYGPWSKSYRPDHDHGPNHVFFVPWSHEFTAVFFFPFSLRSGFPHFVKLAALEIPLIYDGFTKTLHAFRSKLKM